MQPEEFIPILIIGIPILALLGGILLAVVRTVGQQRLMEMAQRERLAAIERGADPSKLPPPPSLGPIPGSEEARHAFLEMSRRRAQWLTIAGIIFLCLSLGLGALLWVMDGEHRATVVAMLPFSLGVGLLVSARVVSPRG